MRKYNVSFARLLIIDRKYTACQGILQRIFADFTGVLPEFIHECYNRSKIHILLPRPCLPVPAKLLPVTGIHLIPSILHKPPHQIKKRFRLQSGLYMSIILPDLLCQLIHRILDLCHFFRGDLFVVHDVDRITVPVCISYPLPNLRLRDFCPSVNTPGKTYHANTFPDTVCRKDAAPRSSAFSSVYPSSFLSQRSTIFCASFSFPSAILA